MTTENIDLQDGKGQSNILTSADLMTILHVSRSGLYRMIETKAIPAPFKLGTHRNAWMRGDIESFIRQKQEESRARG